MKKTLSIMLISLLLFGLLLMFAGCKSNLPVPSPTPKTTVVPTATMAPTVSESPAVSPNTPASPGGAGIGDGEGAGAGTITGFEEGKTVDAADAPEVEKAIKAKYPDAKIKTITYETHMSQQVYRVVLEKAQDGSTDFYVTADGTVSPYSASASASPATSPDK